MISVLVLLIQSSLAIHLPTFGDMPNPIYEAKQFMSKVRSVPNGVLYNVNAPNETQLLVMHLYGNATERGFAHGSLLAEEAYQFLTKDLVEFYKSEVDQIPLDGLPQWLQTLIKDLLKRDAPGAFDAALGWVYQKQVEHLEASPSHILDEIKAIAQGICSTLTEGCNAAELETTALHTNMLPELIQMQCSMLGAWGAATPEGNLVQLRSLDFGGGPFADRNVLVVHHPTDSDHAFASLSFPGFAGAVTGFSEKICQSEKVDDVTGGRRPKGSYDGQAVASVIRDMLQFASSTEDAVAIAQRAQRTWSVWLGFGDFAYHDFQIMLYTQESAKAYDDKTLPALTGQTAFESVAYVDKHPQPSAAPDLPDLVRQYYGQLSPERVAQYIPRLTESGDVHIAVYDFGSQRVMLAMGTTDSNGDFTRYAYQAPFLSFDMQALWQEPAPKNH